MKGPYVWQLIASLVLAVIAAYMTTHGEGMLGTAIAAFAMFLICVEIDDD